MDFANYWFSSAAGGGGYEIGNSLRFRGSQNLQRTLGTPSSSTTGSWSFWFKRARTCQFWKTYQALMGCNDVWRFVWNGSEEDLMYSGSVTNGWSSKERYCDSGAWYHHLLVYDTSNSQSSERLRLYINGIRRTIRNGADPSQNANKQFGTAQSHRIGSQVSGSANEAFDGYMAEFHHIDGQALSTTDFGEFNDEGVWIPKEVSGLTYGNNGFYLDFSDPSNIGADRSGRGNNWTPTGFELTDTSSTSYDLTEDSPTNNFATLCNLQQTNAGRVNTTNDANLTSNHDNELSINFPMNTISGGKYYAEVTVVTAAGAGEPFCGIFNQELGGWRDGACRGDSAYSWMYKGDANKRHNQQQSSYGSNWRAVGSNVGILLDLDNRQLSFRTNGTSNGVAYSSLPDGLYTMDVAANGGTWRQSLNAGQRPFKYSIPAGYEPLATASLPDADIINPAEYFKVVPYTGNGGTLSVTTGFQPDLVIIKNRTSAKPWAWFDSVRGPERTLFSSLTDQESYQNSAGYLTSFNSNGFTVVNGSDSQVNWNGDSYVSYSFRRNPAAGLDIVTYTGNGSAGLTIAHNLGVKPACIMVKRRNGSGQMTIYHHQMGAQYAVFMPSNASKSQTSVWWNNTEPTSSVFTLGSNGDVNANGGTYVAYVWAEIPGFSNFGTAYGNGNSDGWVWYAGMRPALVITKDRDSAGEYYVQDTQRSPYNYARETLKMLSLIHI